MSYLDLSRSSTLSSPTWLVRYPRQRIVFLSDAKFKFSFVHFPFEHFRFKSSWGRTSILFLVFIYVFDYNRPSLCMQGFSCGMQLLGCSMWRLVPWPGIELWPPALRAWSLSHWSTSILEILLEPYSFAFWGSSPSAWIRKLNPSRDLRFPHNCFDGRKTLNWEAHRGKRSSYLRALVWLSSSPSPLHRLRSGSWSWRTPGRRTSSAAGRPKPNMDSRALDLTAFGSPAAQLARPPASSLGP